MNHAVTKHRKTLAIVMMAMALCERGQGQSATQPADALLDVLVFGTHAAPIEISRYSPDLRRPIAAYLQRAERFITRLPRDASPNTDVELVQQAWIRYEQKLAALSDDDRAPALAAEFVQQLKPCYEWEGFHDCPEHEARFAEAYLDNHRNGPFNAYLSLLVAHRWICAAEGYRTEANAVQETGARNRYNTVLPKARASADPMIRAAAEALALRGACFSQ